MQINRLIYWPGIQFLIEQNTFYKVEFKHKLDIPIPVELLSQVKTAEQLLNDHCGKKESTPPTPQLSNRKIPLAQQESVQSSHNTPQKADEEREVA